MIKALKSALGLLAVLFVTDACHDGIPPRETYLAEHLNCINKFSTKAEIDACRQEVRVKWGMAGDGGVEGGK